MLVGLWKKKSNWIGRLDVLKVRVPPEQSAFSAKAPASVSPRAILPLMLDVCVMDKTPMGPLILFVPLGDVPILVVKRPTEARNWKNGLWNPSSSKVQLPDRAVRGFAGHEGVSRPALKRGDEPETISPNVVLMQ